MLMKFFRLPLIIVRQFLRDAWVGANSLTIVSMWEVLKLPYRDMISALSAFFCVFMLVLSLVGIGSDFLNSRRLSEWGLLIVQFVGSALVVWVVNSLVRWREQVSPRQFDIEKYRSRQNIRADGRVKQESAPGIEMLVFPYSKSKLVAAAFLVGGVILIGIFLVFDAAGRSNSLSATLLFVAGILTMVMGMSVAPKIRRKMHEGGSPGVIIDGIGISLFPHYSSEITVRWSDVEKIEKIGRFTAVFVQDPEEYLRGSDVYDKWTDRKNLDYFGTPVVVVADLLDVRYDHLHDCIEAQFNKHRWETVNGG